jgi:thiamine biosynthesis protein ThiC
MKINQTWEQFVDEHVGNIPIGQQFDNEDEIREYFTEENFVQMFGKKYEESRDYWSVEYAVHLPHFPDERFRQNIIETAIEMWKQERKQEREEE